MKLVFEKSVSGRGCDLIPDLNDFPSFTIEGEKRELPFRLPEMAETDISRHYTQLAKRTHGVNDGFYPLGSCTMKYNPRIHEELAALPAFTAIHPLQPQNTVQGCMEVLKMAETHLCEITGMDAMSFQPAAGAHGEFTGLLLIKAYHDHKGHLTRKKILIPDSAHGTNPATAAMLGYTVVSIPSTEDGCVDIEALKNAADNETAGLMLTNPNTLGVFDKNILEITSIVHEAGGLVFYDGANLNAIMGVVRPGDMGFDVIHLNLHKTFSTPHGGGGPGSGACGCKKFLSKYLPSPYIKDSEYMQGSLEFTDPERTIGSVKSFYGNFTVVLKALAYILTLGKEGIPMAAQNAVLNANYIMEKLKDTYYVPYKGTCMHEFVVSLEKEKQEHGVTAMDIAKSLLDYGIHPPTMYFPLIVPEALMIEPTETESKEMLDEVAEILIQIHQNAIENPESAHHAPSTTPIGRPDEVQAARKPVLKYLFPAAD